MAQTISSNVELIDCLAETMYVEFDSEVAELAAQHAEREVPGAWGDVWPERLRLMGKDCGLRITPVRWTIRNALDQVHRTLPVVTLANGPELGDDAGWIVLTQRIGGKTRVANWADRQKDEDLSDSQVMRLLGATSLKAQRTFAIVQPLAPADSVSVHGHSHLDHPGKEHGAAHAPHSNEGHGGGPRSSSHGGGHGGGHAEISPLRRLWLLLQPERRDMYTIAIYALAIGLFSLATPLAIDTLITFVMFRGLMTPIILLALALFACLGLSAFMNALQVLVAEIIQRRLFVRVASDLAHRLPHLRRDVHDQHYGPEMVNRFFEIVTVQKAVALLILDGLSLLLSVMVGLVVLAFYHPFLLGFDVVLISAVAFTLFVLGRGAVRSSISESYAKFAVEGWLEELARHPIAWKNRGGSELAMVRTDTLARSYLDARTQHFGIYFRQVGFLLGLQVVASTVMLGLGGWLVINDQLTLGQLVAAEFIVATILLSFAKMTKHIEAYYDLMAAMDKLGHLFDLEPERRYGEGQLAGDRPAAVRMVDVEFQYPHTHHPVLRHINMTLAPGERLAIVGPSAAGKSTLMELLFGLRAANNGLIEIDGINLRDIRLETLRQDVALIRGLEIIEGTILDNVRMGRNEITMGDVRAALESVHLLDDVTQLPEGLHTVLLPSGSPLAQGQLRRIVLARALAGQPRLLLIDSLLDNLDICARQHILETIFRADAPWSLIVVTNNRDLLRSCDRALVLQNGQLRKLEDLPQDTLAHWNLD